MKKLSIILIAFIAFAQTAWAQFGGGSGTQYDPYLINTATHWNNFCDCLNNTSWNHFSGMCVKLGANITVTTMAGSSGHEFKGFFDGDGHTLTISYGSSGTSLTEEWAAPFRYLETGANIHDLHVDGHIYISVKFAGGIAANQFGTVTITNCRSSIHIISSVSSSNNDGTHGGFIACTSSDSRTSITGCVFDGSIASANTNSPTSRCGGFVGWNDSSVAITITNCLLAADMSTISGGTESCTFVRPYYGLTISNCYYTASLGREQGTKVYSITKGEYVTTLENAGTVSNDYTTSGLTFYNVGLKYGNVLYAPANVYVSLTLDHVNLENENLFFDHYTVSAGTGTLTGTDNPYTL